MSANDEKAKVKALLLKRNRSLWALCSATNKFVAAARAEEDRKLKPLISAAKAASKANRLQKSPEARQQLRDAVATLEDEIVRRVGLFGIMSDFSQAAERSPEPDPEPAS